VALALSSSKCSREVVASVDLGAHTSMIDLDSLAGGLGPHLISTADRISARPGCRREDESHTQGRYGPREE